MLSVVSRSETKNRLSETAIYRSRADMITASDIKTAFVTVFIILGVNYSTIWKAADIRPLSLSAGSLYRHLSTEALVT